jgi:hypothetical protein
VTASSAAGTAPPPVVAPAYLDVGPCRIELCGAVDERIVRTVARQVGGRPAAGAGDVDLVLEFGLLPAGPRRLLGTEEYAVTDMGLILLRGAGKQPVEVLVPFDEFGDERRLRCTPSSVPVPLLVPLMNLAALSRGLLPLHAAAFDLAGRGVLVTGWSRSGKTETLLAMAARGARYVGDEWVYVHGDGRLTGLPEPMRIWSWHLRELGVRRPALPLRQRATLAVLDRVTGGEAQHRHGAAHLRRLRHLLREQRNVRVPPHELLDVVGSTPLDLVILTESHEDPDITVRQVPAELVRDRIAPMLPVERAPLLSAYQAFRYAFPDRRSALLESAEHREAALLAERLDGVTTLLVRHPYPFRFEAMADVLTPWLEGP